MELGGNDGSEMKHICNSPRVCSCAEEQDVPDSAHAPYDPSRTRHLQYKLSKARGLDSLEDPNAC